MCERLGRLYDPAGQEAYCFTAVFHGFSKTTEGSNVACLYSVRFEGREVADHVWIHRSKQMKRLELERGDIITFEAVVGKYPRSGESFTRGEDVKYDFGLDHIKEMRITRKRGLSE